MRKWRQKCEWPAGLGSGEGGKAKWGEKQDGRMSERAAGCKAGACRVSKESRIQCWAPGRTGWR